MPRLLTGNRLETGDVLWWAGSDWSLHIRDAVAVDDDGEALIARLAPQERINDLVLIDVDPTPDGWRPRSTRERVRAVGPSVRPDFALPSLPVDAI
ncbi:MAG: hypothetical protein B7Y82_13445 [Sphingomonadales bacterium 32-65-25]|jgi:hypothetical protein|nr:MAG: hypothetical protein B7Z50_06555 [Sphingomonadales bacterium 12-62-5]OYX76216.1 MAG: hypothetical protein B7Y82_13445 [Sphingomonadales bacterium 32-65-25]